MSPIQSRFRAAIELREMMIAMHRQLLVRENPDASRSKIDAMLRQWVLTNGARRQRAQK